MNIEELIEAIWLEAAFHETSPRGGYSEQTRRRWLARHLVERARYARVKLSHGRLRVVKKSTSVVG